MISIYNFILKTDQFGRGQMTRDAVAEQVSRQLQGHLTYFFPGGGSAMGWTKKMGE